MFTPGMVKGLKGGASLGMTMKRRRPTSLSLVLDDPTGPLLTSLQRNFSSLRMRKAPTSLMENLSLAIGVSRMLQGPWKELCLCQKRSSSSHSEKLWRAYEDAKKHCKSKKLPPDVDPNGVFACNELDLRNIDVYGFDYDYTLAQYKSKMDYVIYSLAREVLITDNKYPAAVLDAEFSPDFAIRGLHYDIVHGLLFKLDQFHQIQQGTAYRGCHRIEEKELLELYQGSTCIPAESIEGPQLGQPHRMVQLADLFALPAMSLLSNITTHFLSNNIEFQPGVLFSDVEKAVRSIHPVMHNEVKQNVEEYLDKSPELRQYLERLAAANKKLFLLTNSPHPFVDRGLSYLLGDDWTDLFDVIICGASKPKFFSERGMRPFRIYDPKMDRFKWDVVKSLQKGVIYVEREIEIQNTQEYKETVNWLQVLTHLIDDLQDSCKDSESSQIRQQWEQEIDQLRIKAKAFFNPRFGSVFRTHHNPTYFSQRIFQVADIYTSNLVNFLKPDLDHTFYPRRGALPHEYRYMFI
ncbi:unnamed protein product [Darwinula stevensoni]|uniref:5'-nucleotidase domain-containing protein 3 n=1 Tax=Darwinula stevensoni TaxID=69355 RepID=A0A7R9A1S0_9CRUS|nr:unnamed protein product [Darwinula stevensoni]CAG0887191.1 unnamed protein product [Darwinula stevensoni]